MTRWISLFSIVIGVVFSVGGPGKIGAIAQKTDLEFMEPPPMFPGSRSEFIDLISRDSEALMHAGPIPFGHKYITGGAGEGDQQLRPEDSFEHREQIKSDSVLPAYCEPPNPCPVGYTAADSCLEEFENTAEFSRNYQAQQQCFCDEEHMFNCPSKGSQQEYEQGLEAMLEKNGLHKSMIAKKFHETRPLEPRRKRSSGFGADQAHHRDHRVNPYFSGEPRHSISKKNGKNLLHMWEKWYLMECLMIRRMCYYKKNQNELNKT